MRCPFCKVDEDRVVNSRTSVDGTTVKRRRECQRCGRRYTTYERIEDTVLKVIKKDGRREDFSREKILQGIVKACSKRPVAMETINQMVDDIERDLHDKFENEVPSREIGELVMKRLRMLDEVAFVRFASVYRGFKAVDDFVAEAGTIMGRARGRRTQPPARRDADAASRPAAHERLKSK